MIGCRDQDVLVGEQLVERGDQAAELRVDLLQDQALPFREHVVHVPRVVRRLVVDEEQVGDAALPDRFVAESRLDQVALVSNDRRAGGRRLLARRGVWSVPSRRVERIGVRSIDIQAGRAHRQPEELGVVRRPSTDAVLLVEGLVPVDADRQVVGAPRRASEPDHADVPDLVADLAHPGAVLGGIAPEVRQGGDQDVARVRSARFAVDLADLAAVADVVTRDAVLGGVGAGADRRVSARCDGGERPDDGVAVIRAALHQTFEVGPSVGPLLQDVPAASVDHERHHDLRGRGRGLDRGKRGPGPIRGPRVESDLLGDGGRDVGERHAFGAVRGRDSSRGIDHERHPLQIHPHRCVAGVGVVAH